MRIPLFFILSTFMLVNCSHKAMHHPVYSEKTSTQGIAAVTDFTKIAMKGNMNVELHTGYKHPSVILHGDARDLKGVNGRIKGNTLFITMLNQPRYGAVKAEIRGHVLHGFSYVGTGTITGNKIHTTQLDLNINNHGKTSLQGYIGLDKLTVKGRGITLINGVSSHQLEIHLKGKPRVQLTGVANVSDLTLDGSGWLGMYWIKSDTLTLRAHGKVQTQLAGIANKLDVELWDSAQFKGRYLRAKTTFVKTHGHSRAEITTLNRQHTLALDASDIYFFKNSEYRSNFMGNNGAVLDFDK